MFRFWIHGADEDDIQNKIKEAKTVVTENGRITIYSLKRIFNWDSYDCNIPINCRNEYAWGYHEIGDVGFQVETSYDFMSSGERITQLTLPEPKALSALVCPKSGKVEPEDIDANIEAPSHYVKGRKYEPRKVIYDWALDFNLGSAVKYIARAGRKEDAVTDLKKAIKFIEFEIEELEKARGDKND